LFVAAVIVAVVDGSRTRATRPHSTR
jgi:hypothetical protein